MQIEQLRVRGGAQFGALLAQGFVPGLFGSEAGGAVLVEAIVASDFGSQELVGLIESLNFFVGKERDQAFLQGAKESFNFAFGLGRRCDAMVDAQGGQGALELAGGIQSVGARSVAEET